MLTFPLQANGDLPLYQQIYAQIRRRILDGELPASTRLPSARSLAQNLGVSRNTVDTAYYQLQAEGYLEAIPKSGFYVCQINRSDYLFPEENDAFCASRNTSEHDDGCSAAQNTFQDRAGLYADHETPGYHGGLYPDQNLSEYGGKSYPDQNLSGDGDGNLTVQNVSGRKAADLLPPVLYDFNPFAIDISHFPFSVWRRLSRQVLMDDRKLFLLGDPFGDGALREAVCRYVCLSRQVQCTPDQVIIGAGVDYLLQMLSLVFCSLSIRQITLESPGYMHAAHIFQNNGLTVSAGRLDQNGLTIASIAPDSTVAYVTPSHQYPVGAVMSYGRRRQLLEWADASPGRYIIEDDHDSEFRYRGKPIPSLQGMDPSQHVIYLGTFSKAIAPAIRVGYLILPPRLLAQYRQICGHYSCTVSRIDQAILTRFLSGGYFEKHVNRMRKIYRRKHDLTLDCLQPLIRRYGLTLRGEHAGLHVAIRLPEDGINEEALLQNARLHQIRLYGVAPHYLPEDGGFCQPRIPGILLGYSNLTEEEITKGVCQLTDARIWNISV